MVNAVLIPSDVSDVIRTCDIADEYHVPSIDADRAGVESRIVV